MIVGVVDGHDDRWRKCSSRCRCRRLNAKDEMRARGRTRAVDYTSQYQDNDGASQYPVEQKATHTITIQTRRARSKSPPRSLSLRIDQVVGAGYTLTCIRFLSLCSNFTWPLTTLNSESLDARRTFVPGWNLVPRCITMMLPAVTNSPPKRFTPRYFGWESRPLREEPTPFL